MDVTGVTRPLPVAAPQPVPANAGAQPGAVKTELPIAATVSSTSETQAAHFEPRESVNARGSLEALADRPVERHQTIDAATRTLVVQVVDARTGELIRQIPDAALLKLRAHLREEAAKAPGSNSHNRVERIV